MKFVCSILVTFVFFTMMILRAIRPGPYVDALMMFGLLIVWMAMILGTKSNVPKFEEMTSEQKVRCGGVVLVLIALASITAVFCVLILVLDVKWLHTKLFLDEVSLFAIMISVIQGQVVTMLSSFIHDGHLF